MKTLSPTLFRIIGQRPQNVPDGWLIHNASRPLSGHLIWQGEWVCGRDYAAINPEALLAVRFIQTNVERHAIALEYVLPETAIAEHVAFYKEFTPRILTGLDLNDVQVRAKILDGWRNRQRIEYERAVGEVT